MARTQRALLIFMVAGFVVLASVVGHLWIFQNDPEETTPVSQEGGHTSAPHQHHHHDHMEDTVGLRDPATGLLDGIMHQVAKFDGDDDDHAQEEDDDDDNGGPVEVNGMVSDTVTDPRSLVLPFVYDIDGGMTTGSEIDVEGLYNGGDFALELYTTSGVVIFHASFRQEKGVVFNDNPDGGWRNPELWTEAEYPLVNGQQFKIVVLLEDKDFIFSANGRQLMRFPIRTDEPVAEISRVVLMCQSSDNCVKISKAHVQGLPKTRPASNKPTFVIPTMPKGSGGGDMRLFIGVMSGPDNRLKRDAVRRSWFQDPNVTPGNVEVAFFIGQSGNPLIDSKVKVEAGTFNDIIIIDLKEDYYSITHKTLAIITHMATRTNAKYLMKCDDDTYVRIDRILELLDNHSGGNLYMGKISYRSPPIRDKASKWYVSEAQFPGSVYPPFAHGPGYVMSRGLALNIQAEDAEGHLQPFSLEDVCVAMWVDHAISQHKLVVELVDDGRFLTGGCTANCIIGHYIAPQTMVCMWEKYQRNEADFCC